MDLGRYLVHAVLDEGRSPAELAAVHGVSRSWIYELLARYRADPEHGLEARTRRPHDSPTRVPAAIEERIITLRKELTEEGFDAGAHTIHYHLSQQDDPVPSVSTIWRILARRGFVTPQPHKRPRSSLIRFEADLPNECWQADTTHWTLNDGTDIEILNIIDDHSRLLVGALNRHTPTQAFTARLKAGPTQPGLTTPTHYRVRHDRIDTSGVITLRYQGQLHHIGIGRAHKNTRVLVLVADLDIRIITQDGELLRHLTLDPTRDYQPLNRASSP